MNSEELLLSLAAPIQAAKVGAVKARAAKEEQRQTPIARLSIARLLAILLLAAGLVTPALASSDRAELSENSRHGVSADSGEIASASSRANPNTASDFEPGLRRNRVGIPPWPRGASALEEGAGAGRGGFRGDLRDKIRQQEGLGYSRKEAAQRIRDGQVCFVAGTLVHTSDGQKPIEEIKVGDEVLSYNEETGQTEYKPVLATYTHEAKEVLDVSIEGDTEPLGVTPEHPFFVRRARDNTDDGDSDEDENAGRWIAAGKLREGDRVRRPNGEWVRVVRIERRATGEKVFNFSVAENHTYFVGRIGSLVHNTCDADLTDFRRVHILNRHRAGAGISGKTEFPASWSDDDILTHISDVATDPRAFHGVGIYNSPYAIGARDGIVIRVDFYPPGHPLHAGKISTAYPLNVAPNP